MKLNTRRQDDGPAGRLPSVLIVDDDPDFSADVMAILADEFLCRPASSGEEALGIVTSERPNVVLLDLYLEGGRNGLEILSEILGIDPYIPVVIATDHPTSETRTEALERGAEFYVPKAAGKKELVATLRRCLESARAKRQHDYLTKEVDAGRGVLLARSTAMRELESHIERIAVSPHTPVLLLGESGTGKSLIAHAIHARSPRANEPFLEVHVGSLSDELLGSELFGHVKGSFTDAKSGREGLFETARGGTLFLDEIGDASPAIQVGLFHAIEQRRVKPVGSSKSRSVDVRIIAATAIDLDRMVKEGKFRNELLGRIEAIRLTIPPLRERREEIPDLVRYFVGRFSAELRLDGVRVTDEAMDLLKRHPWRRYNIRELRSAIERALVLYGHHGDLGPDHFELAGDIETAPVSFDYKREKDRALQAFQRRFIAAAFRKVGSSLERPTTEELRSVANLVGLPEQTVRRIRHQLLGNGADVTAVGD